MLEVDIKLFLVYSRPGVTLRHPMENLGVKPCKSLSSLINSAIRFEYISWAAFCASLSVKKSGQRAFICVSRCLACLTKDLISLRKLLRSSSVYSVPFPSLPAMEINQTAVRTYTSMCLTYGCIFGRVWMDDAPEPMIATDSSFHCCSW